MEPITRLFVKKYVAHDCEARYTAWEDFPGVTYEEAVEDLKARASAWFTAVALVEKVFDPEAFEITEVFLKKTTAYYNYDLHKWCFSEGVWDEDSFTLSLYAHNAYDSQS